jgi:DNA-binding CsgD family transcriptional regulator
MARARDEIVRTCHRGLDSTQFRREAITRLRTAVPFDAVCFPTADPATLMITSNVGEGLPREAAQGFFRVEYGAADYNKFARLARSRKRVRTLSDATGGRFERSARWREVFGPLGLDDDLRAALTASDSCWGFLALHRKSSDGPFTDDEKTFVVELSAHLAEGLRKALLIENATAERSSEAPGLLLLDDDLRVTSSTPAARHWLAEVGSGGADVGDLPSPILAAASSLQALERDESASATLPRSRLRTSSGRWLVVHASRLGGADHNRGQIAVILELAQPLEIAPLIAAAYGLSERERQVLQQVVVGLSTSEISRALYISVNTVQDHLKAIFEKTGVRSRRELVAQIFTQQYLPRIFDGAKVGSRGWFAEVS